MSDNQEIVQERLWKTFFPFAAERQDAALRRKARFVYYTRAETAASILKHAEIWMRKSMCMNDFMEVQHGMQCLFQTYNQSAVGTRFKNALDNLFPGLRLEIEKLFDSWTGHMRADTYITCLSEHKPEEDTLGRLSMWRAYGGTNGVALVMNLISFPAREPAEVLKVFGSPVAYLDQPNFTQEFEKVVANIEKEAAFLREQGQELIKDRIFRMLTFAVLCTKHPGFAEELEWRYLYCPWWQSSPCLKKEVEIIQGVVQPVYKVPLKDIPEENVYGLAIPSLIERIIIGPTRDPLAMREAFAELLALASVKQPYDKVFLSNIPLRQ